MSRPKTLSARPGHGLAHPETTPLRSRATRLVALLALLAAATALPPAAGANATELATQAAADCDSIPSTEVPSDARIGMQFLGDVDGDEVRDIITGYWLGSEDMLEADEVYLHVELASGWSTQFRVDSVSEFGPSTLSHPRRVVTIGDQAVIVTDVQAILVGTRHSLFALADCSLAPLTTDQGTYPELWTGVGPNHSEWMTCLADGVAQVEIGRQDQQTDLFDTGQATFYRLDGDVLSPGSELALDLPATVDDLRTAFPDCTLPIGTFVDDDDSTFTGDIEWAALEGITKGCNPPTNNEYCPDDYVTRGQMAAFLVRALSYTDNGGGDLFTDDNGHTFEDDIDKLRTAGVTKGCNPPINDHYCPDDYVTRGQMAAFLVRALSYTDNGGGDLFTDDNGHTFEDDIDKLRTAGVTKGCNPPINDHYCPDDYVTRGQMAAFLHRALTS